MLAISFTLWLGRGALLLTPMAMAEDEDIKELKKQIHNLVVVDPPLSGDEKEPSKTSDQIEMVHSAIGCIGEYTQVMALYW